MSDEEVFENEEMEEVEEKEEKEEKEINPNDYSDMEEEKGEEEKEEKEENQQKQSYDITALTDVVTSLTATRIEDEQVQKLYIQNYRNLVKSTDKIFDFSSVLMSADAQNLPKPIRALIGLTVIVGSPFILPSIIRQQLGKTKDNENKNKGE